jgi:hypothetical protein
MCGMEAALPFYRVCPLRQRHLPAMRCSVSTALRRTGLRNRTLEEKVLHCLFLTTIETNNRDMFYLVRILLLDTNHKKKWILGALDSVWFGEPQEWSGFVLVFKNGTAPLRVWLLFIF